MSYVEHIYEFENNYLSPYAFKSKDTLGRKIPIAPCVMRTEFVRDRDRIVHCKAFRRLKHKTQVFLSPEGDHYRTRLTHTLEVAYIARSISRALKLNEDLTEAIALGHDLGHTPFGHAGERALQEFCHFEHNEQSLRVIDVLEYDFKGMNLTNEVRDGILNHKKSGKPSTLEGKVVSYSDRIAYLNHDIDDAIRGEILNQDDIPADILELLGDRHSRRINNMILNIIESSYGQNCIHMSPDFEKMTEKLRDFMFERVYADNAAKAEEGKAIQLIKMLFEYYYANFDRLPEKYRNLVASKEQIICDYIATMTDRYAIAHFETLMIPKAWKYNS